jgi:hypothetical protein
MLSFLSQLTETGRVQVSAVPSAGQDPDALNLLIHRLDRSARAELAGDGPELSLQVAAWALRLLESGSRFLVHRAYDEADISAAMTLPCPHNPDPSACWSADLFLRHLPDLIRLARGLAADDPLVTHLLEIARRWPLSSVGIEWTPDHEPDVRPFAGDAALLQLYVDRIISRGDKARLLSPVVRAAVRQSLGDYAADLAPEIAKALASHQE